jgi:hypothetical protein
MTDMAADINHVCGRENVDRLFGGCDGNGIDEARRILNLPRLDLGHLIRCIRREEADVNHEEEEEEEQDDNTDNTRQGHEILQRLLEKQKAINRFAHYYNRYIAHSEGQAYADNQCECIANRAIEYVSTGNCLSFVDRQGT